MNQPIEYPPFPSHSSEVYAALNTFAAAVVEGETVYVSIPITSGRRLLDWRKSQDFLIDSSQPNYQAALEKNVMKPNREHVRELLEHIRQAETQLLIDPSAVNDIPGWVQNDYRYFWGQVIERYAAKVVFVDGWQYSNGCTYEFLIAYRNSKPAYDEAGNTIRLHEGIALIQAALAEIRECFLPIEFIEAVLADLSQLVSSEVSSGNK